VAENAGYEDAVRAAREADTTEAAADRLPEEFIDVLGLVGTPESVRDQLAELRAMGVDLPVVRAPAGTDAAWVERTLTAFAPADPGAD
jgi:alkanesulfonate monooxygenase SsuD/methylene tetrahydromethanopterin reductase-like flavin-dependent oxidoreductase (luciferase family)